MKGFLANTIINVGEVLKCELALGHDLEFRVVYILSAKCVHYLRMDFRFLGGFRNVLSLVDDGVDYLLYVVCLSEYPAYWCTNACS